MSVAVMADLATQINAEHAAAVDQARSAVQRARHAGELLLLARCSLARTCQRLLTASCDGSTRRLCCRDCLNSKRADLWLPW